MYVCTICISILKYRSLYSRYKTAYSIDNIYKKIVSLLIELILLMSNLVSVAKCM
jgi:ubiquitin-protein ligase